MRYELNNIIGKIRRLVTLKVVKRDAIKNKVRYLQIQMNDEFPADDIEHLEAFGFTSRVLENADAVIVSRGGNEGKSICIMTPDRRYRIDIDKGESAMYNHHGDKVVMRQDRVIQMDAAAKVLINAPLTECNDLLVKGTATITEDAIINDIAFVPHTHREQGDGALVSPPQSGGGS